MLKKNHLLVDALRVIKEVVVRNHLRGAVKINFGFLYVIEMEEVPVSYDLRVVVEEDTITAVGEFVAQTVLR